MLAAQTLHRRQALPSFRDVGMMASSNLITLRQLPGHFVSPWSIKHTGSLCCDQIIGGIKPNFIEYNRSISAALRSSFTLSSLELPEHCQNVTIQIRSFSKFSTESNEAVVQDPDLPPSQLKASSKTSLASASPLALSQSPINSYESKIKKSKSGIPCSNIKISTSQPHLQKVYGTINQTCIDGETLLANNADVSTPEELIAMADHFMMLVGCAQLEKSVEVIQSLQFDETFINKESNNGRVMCKAVAAVHKLHHIFIIMVENCIPPTVSPLSTDTMNTSQRYNIGKKYSAITVERALWISRRAGELGMPMHRPLYQRLAMGIVLTSSFAHPFQEYHQTLGQKSDLRHIPKEIENMAEADTNSIGESGVANENNAITNTKQLQLTPVASELLDLFHRAQIALNYSFSPSMSILVQEDQFLQREHLSAELFSEPCLFLLQQRQFEDALALLRGWNVQLGRNNEAEGGIELLQLLGEENTLKALDLAKTWLVGASFSDDVLMNPHANEWISMLQISLTTILRNRKEEANRLSRVISTYLALHRLSFPQKDEVGDDDDFDDDDSDSDFEEDGFEYEDYDSESEEEDDVDSINVEFDGSATMANDTITDITSENFPLILKGTMDVNVGEKKGGNDKKSISTPLVDTFAQSVTPNDKKIRDNDAEKDGEVPIIEGISNAEIRRSIYLRNRGDWVLPDVIPQLERWNRGKSLNFTPEFERHLGLQMMKEDEDDDLS